MKRYVYFAKRHLAKPRYAATTMTRHMSACAAATAWGSYVLPHAVAAAHALMCLVIVVAAYRGFTKWRLAK